MNEVMSWIVRIAGFCLLLIGLLIGYHGFQEILLVRSDPKKIERFAEVIERGSNLDKSLNNSLIATNKNSNQEDELAPADLSESRLKLSYFIAWMIELLLLLLIIRLSLLAIKTGGELVLYDAQLRQFARRLSEFARRGG